MIKELKAGNRPSRERELQEADEGPVLYLPGGKWIGSFNDQILCNEIQSIATFLLAIIIRNHIIWVIAILPL